jgi:molybdate/tungstate transport system ATP-binding protein
VSARFTARGLEVIRGAFRLGPLDLEVTAGEYLVLVGPSGAGKTVLVETLLGWHRPAAGAALLDGSPVADIPAGRRHLAYVPQDLGTLPHLSVRANLTWGLDCRGEVAGEPHLDAIVDSLGLGPLLSRRDPGTLSRGEQQRLAIGRALLTRPRALLLDEPCAALDPTLRRDLQLLLRRLHRKLDLTVVHVTHDREEAFMLGGRIAVLLAGRLRQVAPPAALYRAPADLETARFVAPENLWPGEVASDGQVVLRLGGEAVELALDNPAVTGNAVVGIRPEEVMLLDEGRALRPQVSRNVLAGEVIDVLVLDGRAEVVVGAGPGLRVVSRLPLCAVEDRGLAPGVPVQICLKARSLFVVRPGGP